MGTQARTPRNELPHSHPGHLVIFVERPSPCNCGKREFDETVRRPRELHKAMSSKDWYRFAEEMEAISDRFRNELWAFVPIVLFMIGVLPMATLLAGVLSLDHNPRETIKSDGSELRPHCSWKEECVWNVAAELGCTSKLCRSAGFDHGMFLERSNNMCDSNLYSTVPENTYNVFWDAEKDFGPHLYDKRLQHGLAAISADCVRIHDPQAWGCMAILGSIPFILACAIIPLKVINNHNRSIDQEIRALVFQTNAAMPSGSGCAIEYASDFIGLCKPRRVRPWRALIFHGDPFYQGEQLYPQAGLSQTPIRPFTNAAVAEGQPRISGRAPLVTHAPS